MQKEFRWKLTQKQGILFDSSSPIIEPVKLNEEFVMIIIYGK
jgi:hypothetical protein